MSPQARRAIGVVAHMIVAEGHAAAHDGVDSRSGNLRRAVEGDVVEAKIVEENDDDGGQCFREVALHLIGRSRRREREEGKKKSAPFPHPNSRGGREKNSATRNVTSAACARDSSGWTRHPRSVKAGREDESKHAPLGSFLRKKGARNVRGKT